MLCNDIAKERTIIMLKRISAVVAALTIAICSLASCSKNNDSSSTTSSAVDSSVSSAADSTTDNEVPDASLTIDGKAIDTDNFIVCTIDGKDIDFDTFRYYYYYTISKYTSTYGATLDTIKSTEGGFELLMEDVITALKQEMVAPELAEENDLTLTDDDEKTIDEQIANAKANYESDEAYLADLKSAYLTEDLYRKMLETATIYTKVNDTLFKNDGKYATKKDDFRKIVKDTSEYCREIHVMIPYYSQVDLDDSTADSYDSMSLSDKASAKQSAYAKLDDDGVAAAKEKAKKVAEEVLQKAKDGEDFDKLIETYGWDLGLEDPSTGYYFNKDTTGYPEELVTDAFKLKENEVSSELTENSTYGYFIIKRLPVDMDYIEQNIEDMIYSYDSPSISKLYTDRMDKMEVTYCDEWDKITADSIT